MKNIGYLKKSSKFYTPINDWIELKRNDLELGVELAFQFEGKAYAQKPIRAIISADKFLANFKTTDATRFCARLKALATVLRGVVDQINQRYDLPPFC